LEGAEKFRRRNKELRNIT